MNRNGKLGGFGTAAGERSITLACKTFGCCSQNPVAHNQKYNTVGKLGKIIDLLFMLST